jgi:ABC-type dipeptide/oligopeptide/nickel transport system permease subunit
MVSGAEESYQYVPIASYVVQKDSIVYQKFVDEGITERRSMLLSLAGDPPVVKTTYYLGTDKFGRDILSRLLIGVRVSLSVGLIAVLISLTIGILLGAIAGYYRGKWVDDLIMWFINVIWSIPTLLLVFAITLALGKGFWQVFIAVGLTMWVNVARLVTRAGTRRLRELAIHRGHARIRVIRMQGSIIRHILPNITRPGNGDRRRQFCIGHRDRSRPQFPRRWRSAAATQLGVDDQRELQFHHHTATRC